MREYWSDSALFLRLNASEREVYVGLWSLADDDGWLPRDVPAIAASLFRYESPEFREGRVRKVLGRLADLGKVTSYRCCIELPTVAKYPRAGRKSTEHHSEHVQHSKTSKATNSHSKPLPDPTLPNPTLPDVAGGRARGGAARGGQPTTFAEAMAANGFAPKQKAGAA